jgi:arginyl-tRNA synthetase
MNIFTCEITHWLSSQTGLAPDALDPMIEIPPDPKLGDYAFPCFTLSKAMKKAPPAIAAELAGKFAPGPLVTSARAVGPYLNFAVDRKQLAEVVLKAVVGEGERYGRSGVGEGKTVVIEYSSPNIAKHLALHHIRSITIGGTLYRIFQALGYRPVGINFLGDWGTNFGQLIVAYKRYGSREMLERDAVENLNKLYVRFHAEAKKDPALEDEARAAFKRLEDGEPEMRALWQQFKEASLAEFMRFYEMLSVRFDEFSGESFYNEKMPGTIQRLQERGLARPSEGALIVDLEAHKMPPVLLRKSDGATLYETRDICAAEERYAKYQFDRMIYVVGSEQRLHFRQIFKVLEMMGYEWAKRCVHVDFGLIRLKEGRMSTRTGNVILLEDVLAEAIQRVEAIVRENDTEKQLSEEEVKAISRDVGIGAVVFADLSSRRVKDVVFDWKDILNFKGETGPYLQYTHARISSILRKYGKPVEPGVDFAVLADDISIPVVKALENLPRVIQRAAETREPSLIATYLLGLASAFNTFYHEHRVLTGDERLARARILLISCVRQALKNGLWLLGMRAPERM